MKVLMAVLLVCMALSGCCGVMKEPPGISESEAKALEKFCNMDWPTVQKIADQEFAIYDRRSRKLVGSIQAFQLEKKSTGVKLDDELQLARRINEMIQQLKALIDIAISEQDRDKLKSNVFTSFDLTRNILPFVENVFSDYKDRKAH